MKSLRFVLASSVATLLAAPLVSAEVYTWQTGGTTDIWSTGTGETNWFLGSEAVLSPWADGNDALFNAATGETITVSGTLAPTTTTVSGAGNWTLVGSGIIGGALVKDGTGTLTLGTGANPYTGANTFTSTTINGGILSIGSGGTGAATSNVNALGSGPVTINSGGTLRLWIQNSTTSTFANNLIIDGGTVLGEDGINVMSGTVEVGANGATFSSKWDGKTLTFNNVISGSGPVTVQRAPSNHSGPAVIMTAKNTYTGGTTVSSGILQLGNDVTVNAGGVGILRGDVTINSGATLRLSNINAFGYNGGSKVNTVNINGGTLLHESNGDNGWGVTYNLTGGTMRSTSGTGQFAFGGNTTVNTLEAANSAVIDGRVILREGNANGQVVFTIADGAAVNDLVINAAMSENNGSHGIRKEGAGTLLLNGTSSYSGATVINGGILALGAAGQLNSSITVNNGGTFRVDSTGKFIPEIVTANGATLGFVARAGATTNANMLWLPDSGAISVAPSFVTRPEAGQTFDLLTTSGIVGSSTITPVFNAFGPTRVTGTAAVNGAGNALQVTITNGAADLIWNNAAANNTWDLNTSANFSNGGTNDVFLSADAVTFDNSIVTGDQTITLNGTLAPSQITVNNSMGNYTFDGSGSLIGSGSLVKSGSSTLTLGSAMTYGLTGDIRVNEGTLNLGNKTILTGSPLLMAGGTLSSGTVNASAFDMRAGTVSAAIAGVGALTKTTDGTAILTANNSNYTGVITVSAGTLQIGAKGNTGTAGSGAIHIETGATVKFDRNNNYGNVPNSFSGSGAIVFDGVTGSITTEYALTGDNTGFSGTITALDGRVNANNSSGNRFGTAELIAVGKETSSGQFWLTGGTFSNNFTISGEGWLETGGRFGAIRLGGGTISGNVTLAGNAKISAHNSTGTIAGAIGDGGQGFNLELGGSPTSGTITLSGASNYTGTTAINNTTVILSGSLGNTAVTVGDATGTIGGHGTIGGSLTFGSSAGSARLAADATTSGALDVDGALTVVGAPVAVTLTTGAFMTMGQPYTLLTYGSTTATAANFTLANPTNFRQGVFAVADGKVTVDVGSKSITWTGANGSNWDIGTTTNWVDNSAVAEKYFQGDAVVFGDAGAGTLTLAAGLTPASVTVDSANDYTFNTGTITSPGILTKAGTGTLLLNTQNTFAGGAVINGGTLAVDGSNGATRLQANAQVTVNNGGTLEVRGTNALPSNVNAVDVVVNEGGMLRVVSGASAASTGNHAHFRTVTLNGATIDLKYSGSGAAYNNESFQLGTGGLTVSGSAPSSVIVSGGADASQSGIALSGSRTFTINDVTNSPAVDFSVAAELENSDSNNGALVKEGLGTMQINADTSYTGSTNVNAGTLLVSAGLNGTTGVTVSTGAVLGGNGTIAPGGSGSISVLADGVIAPGVGGIGTLTINSANTSAFGALFLNEGAKFTFELGTGLQSDKISLLNGASSDIFFGGNTINFSDLSSGVLAQGSYTLFSADIADAYAGLITDGSGFISEGLTIGTGLEAYAGSTLQVVGNDIVLNVVPEPATFASLAGGMGLLLGMRRRRK